MKLVTLCLMGSLVSVAPLAALAQAYPAKPLRLVLGFPPGSAVDVVGRIFAAKLGEAVRQTVVVENRPGAGSNIAAEAVVRAPADGYTLFMGSIANTINASLYKSLPFDFGRDLAAISGIASLPNLLVVHPSMPVHSVRELIATAKARPNDILFGSSGNGTSPHLSAVLFGSFRCVSEYSYCSE